VTLEGELLISYSPMFDSVNVLGLPRFDGQPSSVDHAAWLTAVLQRAS
jgi:hypothetical protein